jgi:hypothetical protein
MLLPAPAAVASELSRRRPLTNRRAFDCINLLASINALLAKRARRARPQSVEPGA